MKPGYKQTEAGVIPEARNLPLLDSVAKRGSGHTPDKRSGVRRSIFADDLVRVFQKRGTEK
jgi:hypothetical protein